MTLEDLKHIKSTLEYALNECPVKDGDNETHFNTFANAISIVDSELHLIKSGQLNHEDSKFIYSLLPEWTKEAPEGLNPMLYGTLNQEGDQQVVDRVKSILNLTQQP